MTPKLWKVNVFEADGRAWIAYVREIGTHMEGRDTRTIYDYIAIDRHAWDVTVQARVAQA